MDNHFIVRHAFQIAHSLAVFYGEKTLKKQLLGESKNELKYNQSISCQMKIWVGWTMVKRKSNGKFSCKAQFFS